MSRIFLLTLLGALALPTMAQTTKPTRFSVSAGSFYPGGSDNDRHASTSFAYTPHCKGSTFLNLASIYLDTNRHRTATGTGAAAVTRVSVLQGLGMSWKANILPITTQCIYQVLGVGIYQRRISSGTTHSADYGPGGKVGLGYQKDALFIEADYSFISRIKNNDPSGLGLRVGVRF